MDQMKRRMLEKAFGLIDTDVSSFMQIIKSLLQGSSLLVYDIAEHMCFLSSSILCVLTENRGD